MLESKRSLSERIATGFALLFLVAAGPAAACGENKFRAGHGLKFHDHRASVYGTVLVYAASANALAPRVLRRAGHTVIVVSDPADMASAIAGNRFDVVIAPLEQVPALSAELAFAVQAPKFVPIVRQRSALADAQQRYGHALSTVAGGRTIIALVNDLIRADV
ncbi:MAG: hypothetical protein AAGI15_01210 [Pseudomonadota bacterium]